MRRGGGGSNERVSVGERERECSSEVVGDRGVWGGLVEEVVCVCVLVRESERTDRQHGTCYDTDRGTGTLIT